MISDSSFCTGVPYQFDFESGHGRWNDDAVMTQVTRLSQTYRGYVNRVRLLEPMLPMTDITFLDKVLNQQLLILRISLHLASLHWLPIVSRIKYKLAFISYNFLSTNSPPYLSDLLTVYTTSRQLRSSSDNSVVRLSVQYPTWSKVFPPFYLELSSSTGILFSCCLYFQIPN